MAKRIQLPHVTEIADILSYGGEEASIFDLIDMMCRIHPVNELTIKIIGKLQPERFEYLNDK